MANISAGGAVDDAGAVEERVIEVEEEVLSLILVLVDVWLCVVIDGSGCNGTQDGPLGKE